MFGAPIKMRFIYNTYGGFYYSGDLLGYVATYKLGATSALIVFCNIAVRNYGRPK